MQSKWLKYSTYICIYAACIRIDALAFIHPFVSNVTSLILDFSYRCAKHYINALLGDGMKDEAMEFIQTCDTELKVAIIHVTTTLIKNFFLFHCNTEVHSRGW